MVESEDHSSFKMTALKAQAIQSALAGDFKNAISLNEKIVESNPEDTETLNRLAFAYSSFGKLEKAKKTYQKVLKLDSLNSIALRGIKRLTQSYSKKASKKETGKNNHYKSGIIAIANSMFLEESGKTKIVELINTADKKTSSALRMGESLTLSIKRLKIFLLDYDKNYIGMLPDDLGKRLIMLMNGSYKYEAYVKSITENNIAVFIKEVQRSGRFKGQPSFMPQERKRLVLLRTLKKTG